MAFLLDSLQKTVDLSAALLLIKDSGVKCSKRDLFYFLDEWGVTQIDRGMPRPTEEGGTEDGSGDAGGMGDARRRRGGGGGPKRKKRRSSEGCRLGLS